MAQLIAELGKYEPVSHMILCHALGRMDVRVNAVNPGPVDTGYIETGTELYRDIADRFNAKRWGTPSHVANLLLFLHSREGAWITGQVINSGGGFRRQNA